MTTPNREPTKIKVICSHKGCPRTRMIDREEHDPPMAATMEISCPWHKKDGEFEEPFYFNKDGKQIIQVGENDFELLED